MTKTRILLHCIAAATTTAVITWLQIRPLGVFFIILSILWVYKTKCSARIEITTPPDIQEYFSRVYDQFSKLRQEKPAIFCLILSGSLGVLAIVGHIISGSCVVLIGLILAALISTKYNFKIIKAPKKQSYSTTWSEVADHDVDEFLPEVNESNLFVLQRASDQAVVTSQTGGDDDEKSEEVPAELLIPDSIPEIDEKSDTSSEDDLMVTSPQDDSKRMEFKKGYFKKDSSISTSSSDDENLVKGLNFQDYSLVLDAKEPSPPLSSLQRQTQSMISENIGSITALGLVSGFVSWTAGATGAGSRNQLKQDPPLPSPSDMKHLESSDESDFELISSEDVTNP